MSLLSPSNKIGEEYNVVVQLLDDCISASIFSATKNSFNVLANSKVQHRIDPNNGLSQIEVDKFTELLNKCFVSLSEEARKKMNTDKPPHVKIKNSTVIIYAPWFVSEKREDIKVGKPDEVVNITQKNIEKALNDTELGGLEADHAMAAYAYKKSIIETFINSIKLNGYSVADSIGKKSKDVSISASFYTASATLLTSLKKEIKFHTNVDPVVITFPKACALFVKKNPKLSGILFIDIENKSTSVCLVSKESSLMYRAEHIGTGLEDIIKKIMDHAQVSREIAHSYLALSQDKVLSDDASLIIKSAVNDALLDWKIKVTSLESDMGENFDKKIVICREEKFTNMFTDILNRESESTNKYVSNIDVMDIVFESVLSDV